MRDEPALLQVGRIGRAHGLRGELLVSLTSNVDERMAPGSVLQAGGRTLVIESSRPHLGKWIVQFEGVFGREAAEALSHQPILGEPVDDPDALWVHELIGSDVVDVGGGSHGQVVAVLDNPASDILELESGQLVPLTFVVDTSPGRIVVDPPLGLLDDHDDHDRNDDGDDDRDDDHDDHDRNDDGDDDGDDDRDDDRDDEVVIPSPVSGSNA